MEVIVTRGYVSLSNFWCCSSLSKVVVLSGITTINRTTVLLLVPTAYLTLSDVGSEIVGTLPNRGRQKGRVVLYCMIPCTGTGTYLVRRSRTGWSYFS